MSQERNIANILPCEMLTYRNKRTTDNRHYFVKCYIDTLKHINTKKKYTAQFEFFSRQQKTRIAHRDATLFVFLYVIGSHMHTKNRLLLVLEFQTCQQTYRISLIETMQKLSKRKKLNKKTDTNI